MRLTGRGNPKANLDGLITGGGRGGGGAGEGVGVR